MRRWPDFKMPGKNAAGHRETTKKEGEFRDIAKKFETGCAAERFLLYSIKSKREGGESDAWFNFAEHMVVFSVPVDIHFPKI